MSQDSTGPGLPAWLNDFRSELDVRMGLEIEEITPERVVGSMPVAGNTQPMGMWHGGASGVLVESLASLGAAAHGFPDRAGVGVDLNVTHHRAVTRGRVHGVAEALRLGGRTVTYQVWLRNDEGELVASGRLTCQLVQLSGTPRTA